VRLYDALFLFWVINMEYTRKNLDKFNLYNLRRIGSEIGVKSPTSMKKAQLITAIIDVAEGRVAPFHSNKGRPKLKDVNNLTKEQLTPSAVKKINDLETKLDKVLSDFKDILLQLI